MGGFVFRREKDVDQSLEVLQKLSSKDASVNEGFALDCISWMLGLPTWGSYFHFTGITYGREKMVALMTELGMDYHNAHKTCDTCVTPWIRSRGDTTMNAHAYTAEFMGYKAQMTHVLISTNPGVSKEEVMANLPSIHEVIQAVHTWDRCSLPHTVVGIYKNLFNDVAAVCEKFEAYELALEYVDAALSPDLTKGGTRFAISRVDSHMLRGRVLAALGRTAEAGVALETAAEEAKQHGLRLYEAFALRDLKLHVLDHAGHSDHGSRRLGAVLRQLKGPASKLTPLMQGLDAAELIAMPQDFVHL